MKRKRGRKGECRNKEKGRNGGEGKEMDKNE